MPTRIRFLGGCALLAVACTLISSSSAKMEQWTDAQGKSFKAEPAEVVGPLALFRLPNKSGKLVPLGQLSAADCVRFAEAIRTLPQPAADWAQTKTGIGEDIYGCATKVDGDRLKPVELKGRPEPRFYVLFFASNAEGKSWGMLGKTNWPFTDLQQKHPGLVEGFLFGVRHSSGDHTKMATQMKVPYLVSYLDDQSRMSSIAKLVPGWGYGIVVSNANGVPLFLSKADTDEAAKAIFTEFGDLLALLRRDNPKGWNDSARYWTAVQPVLHANDTCPPLLIGDPLNATLLREKGVEELEATIYVSAEGKVTAVSFGANNRLPEELVLPITDALRNYTRIVPAVDHGKFVAGSLRYRLGGE